jgi:hypothetical protein
MGPDRAAASRGAAVLLGLAAAGGAAMAPATAFATGETLRLSSPRGTAGSSLSVTFTSGDHDICAYDDRVVIFGDGQQIGGALPLVAAGGSCSASGSLTVPPGSPGSHAVAGQAGRDQGSGVTALDHFSDRPQASFTVESSPSPRASPEGSPSSSAGPTSTASARPGAPASATPSHPPEPGGHGHTASTPPTHGAGRGDSPRPSPASSPTTTFGVLGAGYVPPDIDCARPGDACPSAVSQSPAAQNIRSLAIPIGLALGLLVIGVGALVFGRSRGLLRR